ncbi:MULTISPECIES: DUF418 domain-containing protein [unclassified Pseudonocardia]|uniref:DUF418 domain-containing protein n=1 Tax=unclassified Pseudonocardia TaxID=2619320 RepID=UPI0001FFDDD1|nr:DUF418 domain-containing protein [Pseudonocardia sp. Ae707_Ps1]OLM09102.1 hypothetical protein Ae707Ps1_6049 [Pseudonocardia sp. Ae707_Ps1]
MPTDTRRTPPGPGHDPVTVSPTPVAERALAPDLARGMMLLLIALAHVPWFLWTSELGSTLLHPADGGLVDRIAQAVTIVVVDGRAWTMFGFLFAYGIGQMYARRRAGGSSRRDVRRLLRTRHWWLLGFGLVHAALLWQGDILATYGLFGLVLVPLFLHRSDRTLKIWIGVLLALGAVGNIAVTAVSQLLPAATGLMAVQQQTIAEPSYLASIALRLATWAPSPISSLVGLVMPAAFLIGILAARHRVLDEPARHLPSLRRTAVLGLALGWGAGTVQALIHLGVLVVPNPSAFVSLHLYTGIFAGLGYAALFGLIAHRARGGTPPLPIRALVALGRRSLSGYLTQSLVFVPLLSGWGLGLGAHLSSATAMLVGIGVWLGTVVIAYRLDIAGIRGPAEVLLRSLTYRPARKRPPRLEHV